MDGDVAHGLVTSVCGFPARLFFSACDFQHLSSSTLSTPSKQLCLQAQRRSIEPLQLLDCIESPIP